MEKRSGSHQNVVNVLLQCTDVFIIQCQNNPLIVVTEGYTNTAMSPTLIQILF